MSILVLERFSYAPDGTFGRLFLPNGNTYFSVERPWLGNKQGVSCIPEGVYPIGLRYSPVVKQTSGGEFEEGWEIQGVPDREYIMLHVANWPIDVKGCVGLGMGYQCMLDRSGAPRVGVTESRTAFGLFMGDMAQGSEWVIEVRPFFAEYP